jgi:hypothetical protein
LSFRLVRVVCADRGNPQERSFFIGQPKTLGANVCVIKAWPSEDFLSHFSAQRHGYFRCPKFAPQFQPVGQRAEFWAATCSLPHHTQKTTHNLI